MAFVTYTHLPNAPEQKLEALSVTLKVQRFYFPCNPLINRQPVQIMATLLLHLFLPPLQHSCHYWQEARKIYQRHKAWLQVLIILSVKLIAKVWIMSTFIYIYIIYKFTKQRYCQQGILNTEEFRSDIYRYRSKSGERWVKQCYLGMIFPWRKVHLHI